ncbi:MAG: TssN family type VI secretion system protein [Tannerella sp.]|jgi:hypothetical protein|nr:TssN family type VI secretion system protein [Tannerella sp.]
MSNAFYTILTSYLFMPLLAMIVGFIAFYVAKKNKLFRNRKVIFLLLLAAALLCIPALLGFFPYVFMPYIYAGLLVFYLILGYYSVIVLRHYMEDLKKEKAFRFVFGFQCIIMFIAAALFSMVFNLCSELKFGIWASTCLLAFIFPPLFWETYNKYMVIPAEIYKGWKYSRSPDDFHEPVDYDRLMVLEIELYRSLDAPSTLKIKAKAPANMPFGSWFKMFLIDHNYKFPGEPIEGRDDKDTYEWIFYVKRSFFLPRRYIDYELTVAENRLREKYTIQAKRVSETNNTIIK